MATKYYNLAHGGDVHYNENSARYPQNAFVKDRPEYGTSKSLLKPAGHWSGGHFSEVRDFRFNDPEYQISLYEVGQKFVAGDQILTHIIPHMGIFEGIHYSIWTPQEGVKFTVKLAGSGTVLGEIDASTAQDGVLWLDTPEYVSGEANEAIELVIDGWVAAPTSEGTDPCLTENVCEVDNNLCMSITSFYRHYRGEPFCVATCYSV